MSLPRTILVPTDFSASSDAALDYAIDIASILGASITVLHAFELPEIWFPDGVVVATSDVAARISNEAQAGLDRAVARGTSRGVQLTPVLKQGEARTTILEVVDTVGADLIVMGTHGRRGLAHFLLGSVTEATLRTAKVPVLTIHARPQTP